MIKIVTKTIKNKAKGQKDRLLTMFRGLLLVSLLENLLISKGMKAKMPGRGVMRASEGTIRTGQNFNATWSFNSFWNVKILSK